MERPLLTLRVLAASVLLLACVAVRGEAAAQGSGPPLRPGHWSYELLDALEAERAVSGWAGEMRSAAAGVLGGTLADALRAAREGGDAELARFLENWGSRLARESPVGWALEEGAAPPRGAVEGQAGYRKGDALLLRGTGEYGSVGAAGQAGAFTGWVRLGHGGWEGFRRLREGGLGVRLRAVDLRAGRQEFQIGPGQQDLLLGGRVPIDAVALQSNRRHRLPGPLSLLGPVAFQVAVGRLQETGGRGHALWGMTNFSLEPHERIRLGVWRTARFGGEGMPPPNLRRILKVAVGAHNRPNWEDQIAALSLRVRWSVFGKPLASYALLGFTDSAGAYYEDPAVVTGLLAPLRSRSGLTTLRYEYAAVGRRAQFFCPGCEWEPRRWYGHGEFGPWTVDGMPMGHELGGYGAQHSLRAEHWFGSIPLRLHLGGDRTRREDGNLQETRWPGVRHGLEAGGGVEARKGLFLQGALTWGRNRLAGTEWGLELDGRWVLGRNGGGS